LASAGETAVSAYPLQPLGDQAALADLADEARAVRFTAGVRAANPAWLVDVVQAYTRVAVFFDLGRIRFREVADWLGRLELPAIETVQARRHVIPCCYELQSDMNRVVASTGLPPDEVVRRHAEMEYTVYAIGFCPGFPYLGYLPPELCGVPRLEQPRLRVEAGSVGLTGRQTGIYTEPRPGGWNLIGRTPLQLVDVQDGYFPLRTGDRVSFAPIDTTEFERLRGQRL
jgi:inhibitor of KinA